MADKKISQLTAASTPLAGTEVLPIVQSGATVKIAISDVTAGRAVSGTQFTASTGNFIIGTAGKGIDFSINPSASGMTSELLNDYEEGTWTPVLNGFNSTNPPSVGGVYTKVGRLVTVACNVYELSVGDISTTSASFISGMPFSVSGTAYGYSANMTTNTGSGSPSNGYATGTSIYPGTSAASAIKYVTVSYFV